MKRINDFGSGIALYRDMEFDEYQVRVKNNENATYFTDDKDDAMDTAKEMARKLQKGTEL